jgi:hypothetical protein
MTAVDLDELARRPQRYWNADGLPDLMMGLLWIVWGAALLLGRLVPDDWRSFVYWMVVPALLIVGGFASVWATKKLKARLTFPRTGYVEWHDAGSSQRRGIALVTILAAVIVAALIVALRTSLSAENNGAAIITVMLSLAFVVASIRHRAPHYLVLAAVAAVLAVVVARLGAGIEGLNWVFVVLGAACAALGALRLTVFLRNHPRLPEEGA